MRASNLEMFLKPRNAMRGRLSAIQFGVEKIGQTLPQLPGSLECSFSASVIDRVYESSPLHCGDQFRLNQEANEIGKSPQQLFSAGFPKPPVQRVDEIGCRMATHELESVTCFDRHYVINHQTSFYRLVMDPVEFRNQDVLQVCYLDHHVLRLGPSSQPLLGRYGGL